MDSAANAIHIPKMTNHISYMLLDVVLDVPNGVGVYAKVV